MNGLRARVLNWACPGLRTDDAEVLGRGWY